MMSEVTTSEHSLTDKKKRPVLGFFFGENEKSYDLKGSKRRGFGVIDFYVLRRAAA